MLLLDSTLQSNEVKHLPRLTEKQGKRYRCKNCLHYDICWDRDKETIDAMQFGRQPDFLNEYGIVKVSSE